MEVHTTNRTQQQQQPSREPINQTKTNQEYNAEQPNLKPPQPPEPTQDGHIRTHVSSNKENHQR